MNATTIKGLLMISAVGLVSLVAAADVSEGQGLAVDDDESGL